MRPKMTILVFLFGMAILAEVNFTGCGKSSQMVDWPVSTAETKPWSRWWWHGSSVTKEGITAELELYQKAGLGGLELTPIYGVIGDELNFINYLSPAWMDMLEYTLAEAERLGLGIDMANGTGWPFGSPWVGEEDACRYLTHQTYILQGGDRLAEKIVYEQEPLLRAVRNQVYQQQMNGPVSSGTKNLLTIDDLVDPLKDNLDLQGKALDQVRFRRLLPLEALMAYGPDGQVIDLTTKVDEQGDLDWVAPQGEWKLYALFQGWHGKLVERAAPGGEGYVIDHFSASSIHHYLTKFDTAFTGRNISGLRAFFNDSYEVDDATGQANWTPRVFEEFEKRRGYDFREYLPGLFGEDDEEINMRVLSDYRETISDLILATFTEEWASWAKDKEKIIRNQSHGSPGNILDLYAASDIPETEGTEILRIKFASSAAHVSGRPLVSAEAATWLNEHFSSTLSDVKQNVDRYLVGGVNHLFYHGTCYSPPGDSWPGRLFYASIHVNPRNPLWKSWPALNTYITRCQSFLQAGIPDHDVLLYFPMYDRFASPGEELLEHFDGYGPTLEGTEFEKVALILYREGFAFDFISDKQILNLKVSEQKIETAGIQYQTIVVPSCRFMPLSTLVKLRDLAEKGATIIFLDQWPPTVPGLADLERRQLEFNGIINELLFESREGQRQAQVGEGLILTGDNLKLMLNRLSIKEEPLVKHELDFVRRNIQGDWIYLITNWSKHNFEGWITLSKAAESMVILDPMSGNRGLAQTRSSKDGGTEIYLAMRVGDALILHSKQGAVDQDPWVYSSRKKPTIPLTGKWSLHFQEGGPGLPGELEIDSLQSWTDFGGIYESFSGTATYRRYFQHPGPGRWLLDLGQVHEVAKVMLNGENLGIFIGPHFEVEINEQRMKETNLLEIEVTNLMANRIIDMDRRNIYWKKFYNINFPARLAENRGKNGLFDASNWKPLPSGLLGPVNLVSLQ